MTDSPLYELLFWGKAEKTFRKTKNYAIQIYANISLNTGIVKFLTVLPCRVMDIKQVVGDNIRFIRQKRNLTLDDISILTKMSRTYINDVELSKNAITIVRLERIAKALKVDPALLMTKDAYRNIQEKEK